MTTQITADDFRRLALGFTGAVESAHMDHPDFRIEGKIFATLGYPDEGSGMVKLTPEQQLEFVKKAPAAFIPCAGAWGRKGCTNVRLDSVTADILKSALEAARQNVPARKKMAGLRDSSRLRVRKPTSRSSRRSLKTV